VIKFTYITVINGKVVASRTAEVDFVILHQNHIIPVEVKSDVNVKSRSLSVYQEQYRPKLRIRYSLKNLSYKDGLLNIPHFMADYTGEIVRKIL
jgi:predicted AAA+ superfamily ATPase